MIAIILHGMILAFGLILPLGVQNVFIFNQGANQPKFAYAIPVVVTAALCDTLLIILAVMGVSVILLTFPMLKLSIFVVGILFLAYMGWAIWKSKPSQKADYKPLSIKKQIIFAMSVSLLNPHAILDTIGVIGTSSLAYQGVEKVIFTGSTIIVSWLWFIGLALAGRYVGKIDQTGKMMTIVNKISALIIWGVSIYLLYHIIG
ncbi:LysE/ArgO family amino acid transporter [Litchfieldia alkalitelluris]|uniref:LysE/ArgO family amino acid transporter n=1 Tax=Litchfieldia alkalitelluris TaxID=304268 RepID=UPI000997B11F|nr:LysE/ArgO family amino acid transporter [Litchfieldia alkalitelluris]